MSLLVKSLLIFLNIFFNSYFNEKNFLLSQVHRGFSKNVFLCNYQSELSLLLVVEISIYYKVFVILEKCTAMDIIFCKWLSAGKGLVKKK